MTILCQRLGVTILSSRVISHLRFNQAVEAVWNAYERSLKDMPVILPIFGLSGVGKSFSIDHVAKKIRSASDNEVLVVELPHMRSYRAVVDQCLMAFKLSPKAYKNEAQAMEGVVKQIKAKNVKLIIFDEAQNLLERKNGINPRAMADLLKQIFNRSLISMAVFGLPETVKLFQANEQFTRRSLAPFKFYPYEWSGAEFRCFRSSLGASLQYISSLGIQTFASNDLSFAKRMYVASSGRVAFVEKLIEEVVFMGLKQAHMDEFNIAYQKCGFSFFLKINPFDETTTVTDQDMAASYVAAMSQAGVEV